ncbi:MAG TPA: AMIN domain-containing protein [Solirubrobacterales bacterium]
MNRLRSALVALAMLVVIASPAAARGPGDAEVISVAVTSAPGSAEIMIGIRGAVEVRDFMLSSPFRLVLDVAGATLTANLALYDGIERAGIQNIRYAQFSPGVVRVVIDLSERKQYEVESSAAGIRIKFGAERSFLSWSSLSPAAMAAPATGVRAGAPGRAPEVVLRGTDLPAQQGFRRITVTWDNASIADVAAGFAAYSGKSVIIGSGIPATTTVTAELKDVPWNDAFKAVLAAQGLSATEMPGGVIRIDSPRALASLDSLEPLETRLVRVNYASVSSLSKNLAGLVTKSRGTVVADSATNGLIITDTRSRIDAIVDFVKNLDLPTPLVSIQAKIILVDREDIQALGITYDLGAPGLGQGTFFNEVVARPHANGDPFDPATKVVDLGGSSMAAVGNSTATMTDAALRVIATTSFGGYSLTAFLQAVQTINLADVQAEPLITTLDNTEADLLVGEETPVRVIDAGSVTNGAPVSTVEFKETGIRLTVTPHVTNNRNVLLNLRTERSALQEVAAADLGYIFQKQTATNKLLVDDGETAVIGGLTLTQVTRTRTGIPFLMTLPLVGPLFAYNRTSERRRDLIILVTPRIVESPAMAAAGQ